MKFAKLALGMLLVALAFWVVLGEHLSGVSADATINAPVVTLHTPISGKLTMNPLQLGSTVGADDVLAVVNDTQVDARRLDDLRLQRDQETATLSRLEKEAAEIAIVRDAMADRSATFQQHRIEELTLRLDFAQWRLALLKGNGKSAAGEAETQSEEDAARTSIALNRAVEEVAILRNSLAAARSGVSIDDGYNDAPFSEQHGIRLSEKATALRLQIAATREMLEALDRRIDAEVQRTNRAGSAQIIAGANGIFWQNLVHNDDTVQRGDPVLRIVDCNRQIVTASVSERTYLRLARGQAVTFRPIGQHRAFTGVILRLAGAGAATIYQGMAVAPSERHLQRYDVAIAVPDLEQTADLSCAIGRTGRVFFEARPLDWLRRLW